MLQPSERICCAGSPPSTIRSFARYAGGLSAGVELHRNLADAGGLVRRLLQVGVLTKETHRNTIRFAPPLIINESQIHWAVDRLTELLHRLFRRSIKKKPLARASYPEKRKSFSDKGNASAAIALSTPEISRV
jgi:Aminotransferase class-III